MKNLTKNIIIGALAGVCAILVFILIMVMSCKKSSNENAKIFTVVDKMIQTTTNITMMTIESDYAYLNKVLAIAGEWRVGNALKDAEILKNASNEMVKYIENLKSELLKAADKTDVRPNGQLKDAGDIGNKEKCIKTSIFLIRQGNATLLKNKILEYREFILSLVHENKRDLYRPFLGLNVDDTFQNRKGKDESWETHHFDHMTLPAVFTLLNNLIGEVKTAEAMVLKQILAYIPYKDGFGKSIYYVAADEMMHVLYAGIDNPVSISSQFNEDYKAISLSVPGCHVTSNKSERYMVTVPANLTGKSVTATVNLNTFNGMTLFLDSAVFRVKSVPNPRAYSRRKYLGRKKK